MADPQERLRQLQQTLNNARQRGMPGGSPKNIIGGVGSLILVGGGLWLFNNALFNGMPPPV
jgi:prohibitin 2